MPSAKQKFPQKILKPTDYPSIIAQAGLHAIFISARCKSRKQIKSNVDEDLRVEINGLRFREIPPKKHKQIFNIPSAFNGSKLKGLKKTVVFLTVLSKGKHVVSLIPKNSANIEKLKIQKLGGEQEVILDIDEQAEDGNTRPWYSFILVDLPLSQIKAGITVEKRLWDSDDVKIIVNGKVKRNIKAGKYKFWYIVGGVFGWILQKVRGEQKKVKMSFNESFDNGIHYIEFWADRMPILHQVFFELSYKETKAEIRAGNIIKEYASLVHQAAKEFEIDPTIVGAVIYQEQAMNVNFVDTLTDYLGGLLHLNTSIGVGQIRVSTAKALEEHYSKLDLYRKENIFIDYNIVRVERLKDPLTNIRYVAAKLYFTQTRWKKAGFDIAKKADILGTLYNIEDVAQPIEPHPNPESNEFGKGVKRNYNKVKTLLGL